ncbi:MAG TPA: hypothetical protein EYP33_07670 [Pyrodictium sp.]|nr:hypothetical protein [Pyrodictium sp.]
MTETGVRLVNDSLVVNLGAEYTVLSTVSGFTKSRYIVFHSVDEDFNVCNVDEYRRGVVTRLGLPGETPVFLTAVEPGDYIALRADNVTVIATVGLRPPVCVEQEGFYDPPVPGTINVAVVVEKPSLSMSALVDLLRVAVEAKTIAASLLLLRCRGRAAGTVTDAIAVAAKVEPQGLPWAGMATRLGNKVARLVYEAVLRGDKRNLREKLRDVLGLGPEELLDDMLRMYMQAPVPGVDAEKARKLLEEMLGIALRDPNVWAFLVAARELDLHGVAGTLPGISREEFLGDSRRIIADEALASVLAVYIAGFRGLLSTYWVDRSKHRAGLRLTKLPVFEDDAAAALVGALLSRLYDRLLSTSI